MPAPNERVDVHLHLPTKTILKVLGAGLLASIAVRLWPEVVFLTISVLLAVALEPLVAWMAEHRVSRSVSVILLTVFLFAVGAAVVVFVFPPLARQIAELASDLPGLQTRLDQRIRPDNTILRKVVDQMFRLPQSPEVIAEINKPLIWGRSAVSGLMTGFFVLVATLYLLLDGKRLYAWLLAYVPRAHRDRMAETVSEVSKVVYAYVRGQALTSLLFGIFVAILLYFLKVPAVLPLALLAGACDVIPVVGIIIATVPAVLLGVTVSPSTSIIVLGAYSAYHLFETYIIVPRVYGKSLRLSTLAVLLALIIGGALQGILGAVLVLPLVAAYPIIERIWLKKYLADEVLADHAALADANETGRDTAVDAVLEGEKHPGELRKRR